MDIQPLNVWDSELSVGHDAIDGEHAELLTLYGALSDPGRQEDAAWRRARLDDLVKHVCLHFDHEEQIMRSVGYPRILEHRRAHADLLRQIQNFVALVDAQGRMAGADAVEPARIGDFVGRWLVDHIVHDDRALGAWIRANRRG